jgi:hypothetical protein
MAENCYMEDYPVKDERKTKKQLITELVELRAALSSHRISDP